jgi:hypothetical protein
MTDLKFPSPDERDDSDKPGEPLVSLLREAYTPPDAAAWPDMYWKGLETRIMSRVSAEQQERGWWAELVPWARIGLVAAGAIFMLAGVINQQLAEPDDQVAYEAVLSPDITSASDEPIAGQYVSSDGNEALRYYLSN